MKPGEGEQLGDVLQSVDNRSHLLRRHLPGIEARRTGGLPGLLAAGTEIAQMAASECRVE